MTSVDKFIADANVMLSILTHPYKRLCLFCIKYGYEKPEEGCVYIDQYSPHKVWTGVIWTIKDGKRYKATVASFDESFSKNEARRALLENLSKIEDTDPIFQFRGEAEKEKLEIITTEFEVIELINL